MGRVEIIDWVSHEGFRTAVTWAAAASVALGGGAGAVYASTRGERGLRDRRRWWAALLLGGSLVLIGAGAAAAGADYYARPFSFFGSGSRPDVHDLSDVIEAVTSVIALTLGAFLLGQVLWAAITRE